MKLNLTSALLLLSLAPLTLSAPVERNTDDPQSLQGKQTSPGIYFFI